MKTNKGYSLAELLISIAIFSIVMLGIVSIMRNASISYRNENTEVKLQENAQILITQVEELLLDCQSCDVSGAPDQYTITDYAGNSHVLRKVDNTIEYSYAGSDFEVLADNVKKLVIDKQTDGDNRCLIDIEMIGYVSGKDDGSREYTYNASKEVVFRNDVENASYRDDSFLDTATTTTTTTTTGSGATYDIKLARYQLLNLRSEYDINPSLGISISGDTNKYMFVDEDYLNTDNYMESIHEETDGVSGYFTTNSNCNKDTENEYSCVLTAKTSGGGDITLNITTEKVQLLPVDKKGIVFAPKQATNDGDDKNYFSYVEVTGISLRDLKEYYSTTYNNNIKGSVVFKKDGTQICSSGEKSIISNRIGLSDSNKYGQFSLSSYSVGNQCNYSLCYDDFSDDKLCLMFGNGLWPSDTAFDNGNYTVEITLKYPWQSSTKTKKGTYRIYTSGSKLKNALDN